MWGGIRSSRGPAEVGPTVRTRQPPLLGALVHVALCSCASVLLQGTQVFRSPLSTLPRTSVGGLDKSCLSLGGSS